VSKLQWTTQKEIFSAPELLSGGDGDYTLSPIFMGPTLKHVGFSVRYQRQHIGDARTVKNAKAIAEKHHKTRNVSMAVLHDMPAAGRA
jgi:hypothetical protein